MTIVYIRRPYAEAEITLEALQLQAQREANPFSRAAARELLEAVEAHLASGAALPPKTTLRVVGRDGGDGLRDADRHWTGLRD